MAEQKRRQLVDESDLPPLAPDDANDDERNRAIMARMAARFGAPTVADYRRTYALAGLDWPGDEEARRRHIIADEVEGSHGPTSAA